MTVDSSNKLSIFLANMLILNIGLKLLNKEFQTSQFFLYSCPLSGFVLFSQPC